MTETRTDERMGALGAVQARIDATTTERDRLYAERADMFLALSEAGVTQQALADAAGIGFQAVSQNIARARARRDST